MTGRNKNPLLGWHPPAELSDWARAEAKRRGVKLSQVLNEALEHERSAVEGARQEAATKEER